VARLRDRRLPASLVIGAVVLTLIVAVALAANWLAPFPYDEMHIRDRLAPPGPVYFAGTDEFGQDVFSRLLLGSRLSLLLGFAATAIGLGLGVPLGLACGFYRGWFDEVVMRALDVVMSFPALMFVLLILAFTSPGLGKTIVAVGLLFVPQIARVARSVCLDLMGGEFITAARARGEHGWYILLRELLPNAWPALAVEGSLRVGMAILLGAVLSFLGFGVQPPDADWGLMISNARAFIDAQPWMAIAPGLAMSLTVISVSLIGDGLRAWLDPRRRG
jgi:peptide/nickel transport system permease protein